MVLKSPLERDRSAGIPRKPTADIPSSNVEDALAYVKQHAGVSDYNDLTNKPTLGTAAAADTGDFATAAQGTKADSALQNVVEDTTPQLGGDLDANGKKITWNSGGVTIEYSASTLKFSGAPSGYEFDRALTLRAAVPSISFIDTDASGTAQISGNSSAASITISADTGNVLASSAINFSIDGAVRSRQNATDFSPSTSDGSALGSTSLRWADLRLALGAVIDFDADVTVTHSAGFLTVNKDVRITTPGTNAASVLTRAAISSDGTLAANSDSEVPSQKATKTYVDDAVTYAPALTGSTARSLANKVSGFIDFGDFGATLDGSTDDLEAAQDLIDAVSSELGGGEIRLNNGTLLISDTLIVPANVTIVGVGSGDIVTPYGGTDPGPSTIRADFTSGEAVRIQGSNSGLKRMRIDASSTRAAGSYAAGNCGVRVEATDTGTGVERTMMTALEDLNIVGHPGDGLALIAECTGSTVFRCATAGNKGHGLCVNGGGRYSRTNIARPGILEIAACRSQRNGAHGLAIGDPGTDSDLNGLPYRVHVQNFECFGNADESTRRYFDAACWVFGENLQFDQCAFGGMAADGTLDTHGGIVLQGTDIYLNNSRFIGVSRAATVNKRSTTSTGNIKFDGAYVSNSAAVLNPAIVIGTGVVGVWVRARTSSFVTNWVSTGVTGSKVRLELNMAVTDYQMS